MKRLPKRVRRAFGIALIPLSLLPFVLTVPTVARQHEAMQRAADRSAWAVPDGALLDARHARSHWAPFAPAKNAIPVLVYHGIETADEHYSVTRAAFARQMQMLDRAGFEAITPHQYVRWRNGDGSRLPARPILITFDDGRLDSFRGADEVLKRFGLRATMFVITQGVDEGSRFYLHWDELRAMQRSGRWDLQEHSHDGHRDIVTDARGTRGPFFANREYRNGRLETLAQFEARVTADLRRGRERLTEEIPGFEAATFAAPYSNYGQNTSNDPRVANVMRGLLGTSYSATFTQNDPAYSRPDMPSTDVPRFEVHHDTTADQLYDWLRDHRKEHNG